MRSWPKLKVGQVEDGSNIVQNHSSSPYEVISAHYLPQFTWKVYQKWNYVKLKSVRTVLRITRLPKRKLYLQHNDYNIQINGLSAYIEMVLIRDIFQIHEGASKRQRTASLQFLHLFGDWMMYPYIFYSDIWVQTARIYVEFHLKDWMFP